MPHLLLLLAADAMPQLLLLAADAMPWLLLARPAGAYAAATCLTHPAAATPPHARSALLLPHGTATFLTAQASSPMQQCLIVSAWLELAVGAVAPLCILLWLDRRTRPAFEARQQQQQRGQGQQQGQQPAEEPAAHEPVLNQTSGLSGAVRLYLGCSVAWCVLCSLYSWGSL